MRTLSRAAIVAIVLVVVVAAVWAWRTQQRPEPIRYGISPYQDLAMPKIAEGLGLYQREGLDVELVTIAWEDVIPSLAAAGQSVDVAIASVNTLLPRAENINLKGGGDVVFYFPLWVFKGAALMTLSMISFWRQTRSPHPYPMPTSWGTKPQPGLIP